MEVKLAKKLLEVQKEIGVIKKDATNPYFKSKYADINSYIEVVKPVLNKHGLVMLQPLSAMPDKFDAQAALETIIIDGETGESVSWLTPLPNARKAELKRKDKLDNEVIETEIDPQKQGGLITYWRRYAVQSIFFLQAEDDDANEVSGKVSGTDIDYPKRTSKNTPNFGKTHLDSDKDPLADDED